MGTLIKTVVGTDSILNFSVTSSISSASTYVFFPKEVKRERSELFLPTPFIEQKFMFFNIFRKENRGIFIRGRILFGDTVSPIVPK